MPCQIVTESDSELVPSASKQLELITKEITATNCIIAMLSMYNPKLLILRIDMMPSD